VPDLDIIWINLLTAFSGDHFQQLEAGKHVFVRRECRWTSRSEEIWRHETFLAGDDACPPPFDARRSAREKLLAEISSETRAVRLQSFTGVYLNGAPAHWRQKIEISGLNVLRSEFTWCVAALAR
jgi:hypothetical protein